MKVEELVTKQQLQIESLKENQKEVDEIKSLLVNKFIAIGAPLNDNKIKLDKKQMAWAFEVYALIETL